MSLQPRFAWLLALGCLGPVLLARISSLLGTPLDPPWTATALGVAAIVALVAIQAHVTLRRGSAVLLLAQALLTFGPYLVLGAAWGPIAGILGAAILLTLTAPASWWLFVAVVTGDAVLGGFLRGPGDPAAVAHPLLLDLMVGLTLFAVSRLAQLVARADDCRRILATAQAQAQRWRVAAVLRESVGTSLSTLVGRIRAVREATEPARAELHEIAALARGVAADARTVADVHRDAGAGTASAVGRPAVGRPAVSVGLRLARRTAYVLLFVYTGLALVQVVRTGTTSPGQWATAAVTLVAAGALHLHHGMPRADATAPRFWLATLPAQVLLLVGAAAVLPGAWVLPPLVLAVGAVLVRVRPPWSWALACAAVASLGVVPLDYGVGGPAYYGAWMIAGALSVYALCNLPEITRTLDATRDQLVRTATRTERLRFARDVHDLLGFHLAAIGLKCELAARASGPDPDSAAAHLADVQRSAEDALSEVRSITGSAGLDLRAEITAARSLLTAAGVRVTVDLTAPPVSPAVDHLLGIILREAVTNVVRHSRARTCTITVAHRDAAVRLHVVNDGVRAVPSGGHRRGTGLGNLTARAEAAGGRIVAAAQDDTFAITALVPHRPPSDRTPERTARSGPPRRERRAAPEPSR